MSQKTKLLRYLQMGKSISPLKAWRIFGIYRLSGRILDLRREGHNIKTDIIERDGKRFARYWL